MGAQDNLTLAKDFIAKTGTKSFPMVWESNASTWRHYGIRINSETWLLDKQGNRVGSKMFALNDKAAIQKAIS